MFRSPEPLSRSGRIQARQYLKRAGLFAAGLLLLWVALQLSPSSAEHPPVFSDNSGAVALSSEVGRGNREPRLFSLGNLAAFGMLIGGALFAFVAHRRYRSRRNATSLIESLAELGVGQGQQLRLVRCGGDVLLIGITSHHISVLRDFDPRTFAIASDAAGAVEPSASFQSIRPVPATERTHFADVLRQVAGRYAHAQPDGTTC